MPNSRSSNHTLEPLGVCVVWDAALVRLVVWDGSTLLSVAGDAQLPAVLSGRRLLVSVWGNGVLSQYHPGAEQANGVLALVQGNENSLFCQTMVQPDGSCWTNLARKEVIEVIRSQFAHTGCHIEAVVLGTGALVGLKGVSGEWAGGMVQVKGDTVSWVKAGGSGPSPDWPALLARNIISLSKRRWFGATRRLGENASWHSTSAASPRKQLVWASILLLVLLGNFWIGQELNRRGSELESALNRFERIKSALDSAGAEKKHRVLVTPRKPDRFSAVLIDRIMAQFGPGIKATGITLYPFDRKAVQRGSFNPALSTLVLEGRCQNPGDIASLNKRISALGWIKESKVTRVGSESQGENSFVITITLKEPLKTHIP